MSSLTSSPAAMSYESLTKTDPSLGRPKRYPGLAHPAVPFHDENELEDMMTDSAIAGTPPLDLESDSGDENDDCEDADYATHLPRFPISPPSFQPASILHHRKRKDSQEHAVHLFDRHQALKEPGLAAAPALGNYAKGAQGRRPTVTFDLDMHEKPSPSPTRPTAFALETDQRSSHFRHDDGETVETQSEPAGRDSQDMTALPGSPQIRDTSLLQAEQAFRRVSISPIENVLASHVPTTSVPNHGHDHDHEEDTQRASTTDLIEAAAADADARGEDSPPTEIILNHIFTGPAPQDMLVALFDRSSELKALAARHSDFFTLMYSSLSKTNRDDFKALLFQPREVLSDRDWMQAITNQLGPLPPCILEKFKGIVGWIGPDSEDDDDNVLWGEDEYGYRDSSFEQVQIKWLRDIEDFPLVTFQECYPQFFINARERLQGRRMSHGGDQRDQYVIFCETLGLSRNELACDSAWTRRMNGCLERHPELILQLKEIVAYEAGYDD